MPLSAFQDHAHECAACAVVAAAAILSNNSDRTGDNHAPASIDEIEAAGNAPPVTDAPSLHFISRIFDIAPKHCVTVFLSARSLRCERPPPLGSHAPAFVHVFKHATGRKLARAHRTSAASVVAGGAVPEQQGVDGADSRQRMSVEVPALPEDLSSRDLPTLSDALAFTLNVSAPSSIHKLLYVILTFLFCHSDFSYFALSWGGGAALRSFH